MDSLPVEIVSHLFSFVSGKELAALAKTCKRFNAAVNVEEIWKKRCRKDYGVCQLDKDIISWRKAFTHLLWRYGYLLGLWEANVQYYGGLLHVKFTEARIEAVEMLPPAFPHIKRALRLCPLFTIELGSDGMTEFVWHRTYDEPHHVKIIKNDDDSFMYLCSDDDDHPLKAHPMGEMTVFEDWLRGELDFGRDDVHDIHLLEMKRIKFQRLLHYKYVQEFSRLILPPAPSPSDYIPIKPGLFKGTYSLHGVEIVRLSYTADKTAEVVKITGDPNIPARQWTIKADLNRTMVLSENQQQAFGDLQAIDTPDLPPNTDLNLLQPQPFLTPYNCSVDFDTVPRICTYRCHSQGQIAGDNYSNPSTTPGHWIVFDENMFGHLWFRLGALSMYSRVTEDLS